MIGIIFSVMPQFKKLKCSPDEESDFNGNRTHDLDWSTSFFASGGNNGQTEDTVKVCTFSNVSVTCKIYCIK